MRFEGGAGMRKPSLSRCGCGCGVMAGEAGGGEKGKWVAKGNNTSARRVACIEYKVK